MTEINLNLEQIELKARQERAEFIASMAKTAFRKLNNLFVSELRSTRSKTLARLQAS